jgi:hypothetical protein
MVLMMVPLEMFGPAQNAVLVLAAIPAWPAEQ